MNTWKTVKKDGLPPLGVPLIVTIKDHLQGRALGLRYPVVYQKSENGNGYKWKWQYGDYTYDLVPDVSEVVAYMEIPDVYAEE